MLKAVKKRRMKHPNSIMIYQNINVPNPINLFNRLKASGILKFKGNYCRSKVEEAELINKMGELYAIVH